MFLLKGRTIVPSSTSLKQVFPLESKYLNYDLNSNQNSKYLCEAEKVLQKIEKSCEYFKKILIFFIFIFILIISFVILVLDKYEQLKNKKGQQYINQLSKSTQTQQSGNDQYSIEIDQIAAYAIFLLLFGLFQLIFITLLALKYIHIQLNIYQKEVEFYLNNLNKNLIFENIIPFKWKIGIRCLWVEMIFEEDFNDSYKSISWNENEHINNQAQKDDNEDQKNTIILNSDIQ